MLLAKFISEVQTLYSTNCPLTLTSIYILVDKLKMKHEHIVISDKIKKEKYAQNFLTALCHSSAEIVD